MFLAAAPRETQAAARFGIPLAHAAYRIGAGSTLLRQNLPMQTRGGVLAVSDRGAPRIEDPEALCAAAARECSRRGYSGVLLDFEEEPQQDRIAFAQRLVRVLSSPHRTVYLPESYAQAASGGVLLIGTALSGGSLGERLREAVRRRGGAGRLALDVERLRMDFRLPAPTGMGTPLSSGEFQALVEREKPAVFFSQDLCARYFTYSRQGELHFVLFDDADTLRKKLQLGQSMGFEAAFLMWPEIADIAGELDLGKPG